MSSVLPLPLAQALGSSESARIVAGAPRYWVTDHGRVFSLVKGVLELSPTPNKKGYLCAFLYRDSDRDPQLPARWGRYVHELVALAFLGPRPVVPGVAYQIDHVDGDKTNNSAANLQYVTRSENIRRALASGAHPSVKLTPVEVWKRRCQALVVGDREVICAVTGELGMSVPAVRNALSGRTWATVPHPADKPTADDLAKALNLGDKSQADRLLELSPFSDGYVAPAQATARILPFRSSDDSRAA